MCLCLFRSCLTLICVCVHITSVEDGEKKDQDKGKKENMSDEEKKPLKKRRGQRKEPAEAFMAAFLAGLDVYQTKTLVSFRRNVRLT